MEIKEHPHSGHRKRLRTLIDKAGLESLSDIQILEQILTMAKSRGDTNITAHNLLKEFGSISNILDADPHYLMKVPGVGEITAKMLTYLPQIFTIYLKDKNKMKFSCKNYKDIDNYLRPNFQNFAMECVIIAFINKQGYFTHFEKIGDGDFGKVEIDKTKITASIIKNKAQMCIMSHNHPYGICSPSRTDLECNYELISLFNALGVHLFDNVIIGNDGMYSFKYNQKFLLEDKI